MHEYAAGRRDRVSLVDGRRLREGQVVGEAVVELCRADRYGSVQVRGSRKTGHQARNVDRGTRLTPRTAVELIATPAAARPRSRSIWVKAPPASVAHDDRRSFEPTDDPCVVIEDDGDAQRRQAVLDHAEVLDVSASSPGQPVGDHVEAGLCVPFRPLLPGAGSCPETVINATVGEEVGGMSLLGRGTAPAGAGGAAGSERSAGGGVEDHGDHGVRGGTR